MQDTINQPLYNSALNALTYGVNCLFYDKTENTLFQCVLSIHESYINILHLLINESASYLLKLQQIYTITDSEYSIQCRLKQDNIKYYLILYTNSLQSIVFAVHTESQKRIIRSGLQYFIKEAKQYYKHLSQYDPFRAAVMMTFLDADEDGGNLLDINEIQHILTKMKMTQNNAITQHIAQVNRYLYEREKLKKPMDMKTTQLNELGFQMLMRYYSIKEDLTGYFTNFCPMYKPKQRSQKNSIIDVVRNNEKPLMSATQLKEFYKDVLYEDISLEESKELILCYPVYDGENKQTKIKNGMLNFNNFCSLLSSRRNSIVDEKIKFLHHDMNHPLVDYYIYTDCTNLAQSPAENTINHYELSLKRGCRCLRIIIEDKNKNSKKQSNHQVCLVRLNAQNWISFQEILKIISTKAFEFNHYPLILNIDLKCDNEEADKAAKCISTILGSYLYIPPLNNSLYQCLPSPKQLMDKIIIMANLKKHEGSVFNKITTLFGSKIDFERKNQNCWNYVQLSPSEILTYEEEEQQNLCNYTRKVLVHSFPTENKHSALLRSGIDFNSITKENYLMQSLFLQNGGNDCGYLLKPNWMCISTQKALYSHNFDTLQYVLTVNVISGQNCIVNNAVNCEFMLEVSFFGNRYDEVNNKKQETNNKKQQINIKKYVTQVKKEGYYVQFNLSCEFNVYCSDVAILVMNVVNKEGRVLGGRSIKVKNLREGLRTVFLVDQNLKEVYNSYLIVQSKKKEVIKKISYFNENKDSYK